MTEEKLFKINLSIKFKHDMGVRRFIIRADDFDLLFEKLACEMSVVAPNARAMFWTDGDGDKIYIGSGAELEEAYEQLAKNNNNVLNIETKEEEKEKKEEKKEVEKKEEEKQPEPRKQGALHNAICDLCDTPIRGHRFRCIMCPDYDLCGFCESTGSHADHAMLRIVDPAVTRIPWEQLLMESRQKLENFTCQGVNRLMEVGNLLTNTLANFGIQATYEVRGNEQNNTNAQETPVNATPEAPKETPKEAKKEEPKEAVQEEPKEAVKEEPKEVVQEEPKEAVQEEPKKVVKEEPKEAVKEAPKEAVKEEAKETVYKAHEKVIMVTKAPKKALTQKEEEERHLRRVGRVVKRFTEDCMKAKEEAAKKLAEEPKKEDPTKKYESVFAKVDRAAALAFPHLAESRDKVKNSETSKKVVPEEKTTRSVFDQPREPTNSLFQKNRGVTPKSSTGFSFAAKTESKPMFGGFKPQETVQKEQAVADRPPANHVGPGIFSAKCAKPKIDRAREERRRESSHRHREFDYRSDDSAGRTPSPPPFSSRNNFTRGPRYEKEPATKTAANDEFVRGGFRGYRDDRGFTSARDDFGSGFGSPFGEFNRTTTNGNGTSKRGGFDNPPTFGSSAFGRSSGCNSGFGSGGFGKSGGFGSDGFGKCGGFGSGGFGKSASYYDDCDRGFYPRDHDYVDAPRFGKDSSCKGGFKGYEPTSRGFGGFVPPPKGFEPKSKGFEPSSKRFEPSPKGFEPSSKGFEPAPRGFDRPPQKGFDPAPKGFGGFERSEKPFEPSPRGFSTVSNTDAGFRDAKSQRGGFCNHYNPPAQEKFRPPRVSRPMNPYGEDPSDEDLASTLTTMMFKKKETKTEEKKKNENVKKTKKVEKTTVFEPVKDEKMEGVVVLPDAVEKAEASLALTTCQVEIEKKDPFAPDADADADVVAEVNRVIAILDAPVDCGQTFVLTPTNNTQAAPEAQIVPDVAPSAPAVTDTQSIGSEVEHIEDVDSDGWVEAVYGAERHPETNVYPQLIEETSTAGQAREETYAELLIMGFTDVEARRAIAHCGCELMQCIDYITEQQP